MRGVEASVSLRSELRGRLWSNHFGWQSLFDVGHAPSWEHWTKSRPADQSLTGHPMSFDRLKRPQSRKRLPGHKLKPSRATLLVQNSKPHLSMKQTYILAIDVAKHKVRAALSGADERLLFEKDLPVSAGGLRELLVRLREHVAEPEGLLVLIEATGMLHLNWSVALIRAGYAVVVINPLIARRLYTLGNSIRDNKSDPIDARQLCGIGRLHGEKLLSPKAAQLKKLAAESMADPELAQASRPALLAMLQSIEAMETRLRELDRQIEALTSQSVDPQTKALVESIPGFGALNAAKLLAFLPGEILHAGSNRQAAARLQAYMGNDPRVRQSGQWQGQTKMSKRGVEMLRTALFQCAFSASQHDPELRSFYQRKRAQGKHHEVALSHLMRILTRRLVAVLRSGQPYQPNDNSELKNAA